jgi:hypothetical protein
MMPKQEVSVEDSDRISTPTFFARYFSLTCMPSQKSMFHCGEVSVSMETKMENQRKINVRCTIRAGGSSMETKASPFALRRILPPTAFVTMSWHAHLASHLCCDTRLQRIGETWRETCNSQIHCFRR